MYAYIYIYICTCTNKHASWRGFLTTSLRHPRYRLDESGLFGPAAGKRPTAANLSAAYGELTRGCLRRRTYWLLTANTTGEHLRRRTY